MTDEDVPSGATEKPTSKASVRRQGYRHAVTASLVVLAWFVGWQCSRRLDAGGRRRTEEEALKLERSMHNCAKLGWIPFIDAHGKSRCVKPRDDLREVNVRP
jgi:hypothetical protein